MHLPVVGWHTPRPHGLQIFSHAFPQRLGGHEKAKLSVNNELVVVGVVVSFVVVKISADERLNNITSGVEVDGRDVIVVFDIFIRP